MDDRLSDYDGDDLRKIAAEMMGDIARIGKERQEDERKLDNQRRALVMMTIDSIDAWLDCHPERRGGPFVYTDELAERLLWIFSLAQSIRDKEKEMARPPRWSFRVARKQAIDRFKTFGGKR